MINETACQEWHAALLSPEYSCYRPEMRDGLAHRQVIVVKDLLVNTGAMREALLARMTQELLTDVVTALDHNEPAEQLLGRLFSTLSDDGHGKLIAWLALDQQSRGLPDAQASTGSLFENIVSKIAHEGGSEAAARHQVYLVATAAMGIAVSGDALARLVGLSGNEQQEFPGWLAERIRDL